MVETRPFENLALYLDQSEITTDELFFAKVSYKYLTFLAYSGDGNVGLDIENLLSTNKPSRINNDVRSTAVWYVVYSRRDMKFSHTTVR